MNAEHIIVGGGAAGMMAACRLAGEGGRVLLVEPNAALGRKLRITGKGRCNLTNACDIRAFLAHVPRNGKFLHSALHALSPQETMAWFEGLGVALKTERGNRVFPVTDDADTVADALERELRRLKVELCRGAVKEILTENGAVSGVALRDGRQIAGKRVLVATGGASYPRTGSTGDGYAFARRLGHTVVPPVGSLVPLVEEGDLCARAQGLSLKNVRLTAFCGGKAVFSDFGELLFTHFGLSGPLVLSASAHIRDWSAGGCRAEIDLKPALDDETLNRRLLSDFAKHKNSDFINALGELLPHKLIPLVVECSGIDPRSKVHSITREQRRALQETLRRFPVALKGPRPVAEAIITSGGVAVSEVNPRTMESKLIPGLFFAGEVLDVDAYTGGFNLQIAWSTATVAARGMLDHQERYA